MEEDSVDHQRRFFDAKMVVRGGVATSRSLAVSRGGRAGPLPGVEEYLMQKPIGLFTASAALVVFCGASSTWADGGPVVAVHDAVQNGQDVTVNLSIPDVFMDSDHDLIRLDADDFEHYVLVGHVFDESEAVDTFTSTDMGGGEHVHYVFDMVEECVPPGDQRYGLSSSHEWEYLPIHVEDSGDPCLPDDGVETGDDGCSVSGVGSDATAGALGLLMLVIGVVGLLVSRRRR
jgi:hypothetical protein